MGETSKFPEIQRANLNSQLNWALQRKIEEDDLSFDKAFNHVALDVLGYDLDAGVMSDGKGDFGIDFWTIGERSTTIFQFKSHDYTEQFNAAFIADSKYLTDLPRIQNILEKLNEAPREANAKVQDYIKELRSAVHRYSLTPQAKEMPFEATIFFCCLANGFTDQASEEFHRMSKNGTIHFADQNIHVTTIPIF